MSDPAEGREEADDINLPPIIAEIRAKFGPLAEFIEPHAYHLGLDKNLSVLGMNITMNTTVCMEIVTKAATELSTEHCYTILEGMLIPLLEKELGELKNWNEFLDSVELYYLFAAAFSDYFLSELFQAAHQWRSTLHSRRGMNESHQHSVGSAGGFGPGNSSTSSYTNRSEGTGYGQQYVDPTPPAPHSHTPSPYPRSNGGHGQSNSGMSNENMEGTRLGRQSHGSTTPAGPKMGISEPSNRKQSQPSNPIQDTYPANYSNNNNNGNHNSQGPRHEALPSSSTPMTQQQSLPASGAGVTPPPQPLLGPAVIQHHIHIHSSGQQRGGAGSHPSTGTRATNPLPSTTPSRGGSELTPPHNLSYPQPIGKQGSPVTTGPRQSKPTPSFPPSAQPNSHNNRMPTPTAPSQQVAAPKPPPTTITAPVIYHHHHIPPAVTPPRVSPENVVLDIPVHQHHIHHHHVSSIPPLQPPQDTAPPTVPPIIHHIHNIDGRPPGALAAKSKAPIPSGIPFHAHHLNFGRPRSTEPRQPPVDTRTPSSPGETQNLAIFMEKNGKKPVPGVNEGYTSSPAEPPHHHHTGNIPSTRGGYLGRPGRGGPPQPLHPSSPTSDGMMGGRADGMEPSTAAMSPIEDGKKHKGGRGEFLGNTNGGSLPRYDNDDAEPVERGAGPRKRPSRGFGRGRGSRFNDESKPCKYHSHGQCRFGDSCRNLHIDPHSS